ncbi:hypothetical protein C8P70_12349 [Myroides indicus]|uniref:Uncharacterized protein n=1 Tax=Myroides indicus TaxID=1323422 RepID=A0A4R7ESU6_9FLAO|nr:hypothetical protein C8P70_12349 [Myroides indicus]
MNYKKLDLQAHFFVRFICFQLILYFINATMLFDDFVYKNSD